MREILRPRESKHVLQCVAVCCSVLQCVAGCYRVLQGVAGCCRVLQCVAGCCRVLHSVLLCESKNVSMMMFLQVCGGVG